MINDWCDYNFQHLLTGVVTVLLSLEIAIGETNLTKLVTLWTYQRLGPQHVTAIYTSANAIAWPGLHQANLTISAS